MVLCHLSATPASCTCCLHGLPARWGGGGQGAENWADGPGDLDTVSSGADEGVATPRIPCTLFPKLGLLAGPGIKG